MLGRLRALWNAPAATPAPPKRVWRDWVLLVLVPVVAIIEGMVRRDQPLIIPSVVVVLALSVTLFWRRARPLLMFLLAFALSTGFEVATGRTLDLYTLAIMLLLIHAVVRWGDGRAMVIGVALVLGATTASVFTSPFDLTNIIGSYVVVTLIITVSLLFRVRATSRMRELDRARSHEREGLARELHDTVAHHVSAIAIQAQAGLATAGTNPDAATDALRVIEAEASRTLAEMRSMVRVLRRDGSVELAPAPGLAEVRELTDAVEILGDESSVPAAVGQAIYRIAQESVTNARRHAQGATRIDVRIQVGADRVTLTVHDDGSPSAPAEPGFGITGMSERAGLLGGTCIAGPGPDGGWIVSAEIPLGRP